MGKEKRKKCAPPKKQRPTHQPI